jgi:hypothetical protein
MRIFFALLWVNILIPDIIKLKLEKKADSISISDLDDIICYSLIFWD